MKENEEKFEFEERSDEEGGQNDVILLENRF
jgi:hypothetical protein